jgi:hypothetical protein
LESTGEDAEGLDYDTGPVIIQNPLCVASISPYCDTTPADGRLLCVSVAFHQLRTWHTMLKPGQGGGSPTDFHKFHRSIIGAEERGFLYFLISIINKVANFLFFQAKFNLVIYENLSSNVSMKTE